MIRSKGVGVFFVTQAPTDVPSAVLAQLGNRVQHALRAFTPEDADALRKTVRTYPKSDLYDLEKLLTELGIGEAAVTVLSESGVPTPVVHTRMRAPAVEDGAGVGPRRRGGRVAARRRSTGRGSRRESARELLAARLGAGGRAGGRGEAREEAGSAQEGDASPRRAATRSRTSSPRGRARSSARRSCEASSGC